VEALIVTSLPNVRYLSGFTGSNGALVLSPGAATLFTDPRYTIQAASESDCRVVVAKGSLLQNTAKLVKRKRWRKLGFERTRISFTAWAELQESVGPGVKLSPLSDLVEAERMVKSPAEVELIRDSVLTNSLAFERTLRCGDRVTDAPFGRRGCCVRIHRGRRAAFRAASRTAYGRANRVQSATIV
jgi:Xaa-Pro aminopeptidase